jgi:hypothetical protein
MMATSDMQFQMYAFLLLSIIIGLLLWYVCTQSPADRRRRRVEDKTCQDTHEHGHYDRKGVLHRCYHKCRSNLGFSFWVGMTIGYPLEHLLWEHVWPFKLVGELFATVAH